MIPDFKTIEERFEWLRANKRLLITAKKSAIKFSDPVSHIGTEEETGLYAAKALTKIPQDFTVLNVKAAINTTNIMDSHSDVHIPGLWSKSLKERKDLYLIKEHKLAFENIISDEIKASAQSMTWKELGYNYEGKTEVLVFDATIEKERNPYMAEQYAKGRVKQHSVGMQYVKLFLCLNSESKFDQEEKANWDKYISQVANRKDAEAQGYFWAVTEAKAIEGSAVPLGSNYATPVISITGDESKTLNPAGQTTESEPLQLGKIAEAIKQSFTNNQPK